MRKKRQQRGRSALAAACLAALALGAGAAGGAPAELDRTFSGDGRAVIDSGFDELGRGLALQTDGKIVVAGATSVNANAAVYRLNPNGSLDASFDGDGAAGLDSGGNELAFAVTVQPNGKIVVAGRTSIGQNAVVYRLNPKGSLDPTFDGDGRVVLDSGGSEEVRAVVVQPDGKIVVAGYTSIGDNAVVYRLSPNGSLDPTFDNDGAVGLDSGGSESANAVAVQADGKIVVVGRTSVAENAVVYRLNPDGSPDTTFDSDGALGLDSGGAEFGYAVAVQPNGKIVVAGRTSIGNNAVVYRLNPNGSPDPAFDGDGAVGLDSGGFEEVYAAALQRNGKIVVSGWTSDGDNAVAYRLRPNGSLDPTFGDDGERRIDVDSFQAARAVSLQRDGRIVLAGWTYQPEDDDYDVLVARLEGDPRATCAGREATIVGTARGERIRGTSGADVIAGLGGRDVIRGLAGNDVVCGGGGNDVLYGGGGRDVLYGGSGRDTLVGGPGRDRLAGGPGRDRVRP